MSIEDHHEEENEMEAPEAIHEIHPQTGGLAE